MNSAALGSASTAPWISATSSRLRVRSHNMPIITAIGDSVAMVKATTWNGSVDQPSTPGPPRR